MIETPVCSIVGCVSIAITLPCTLQAAAIKNWQGRSRRHPFAASFDVRITFNTIPVYRSFEKLSIITEDHTGTEALDKNFVIAIVMRHMDILGLQYTTAMQVSNSYGFPSCFAACKPAGILMGHCWSSKQPRINISSTRLKELWKFVTILLGSILHCSFQSPGNNFRPFEGYLEVWSRQACRCLPLFYLSHVSPAGSLTLRLGLDTNP